jgi:hypothetical protein
MALLRILEYATGAILLLIAVTQVVIPIFRGTLLFPFFRREHELESLLSQARQQELEFGLQKELKQRREHLDTLKHD